LKIEEIDEGKEEPKLIKRESSNIESNKGGIRMKRRKDKDLYR
jgi:hypothetical protein